MITFIKGVSTQLIPLSHKNVTKGQQKDIVSLVRCTQYGYSCQYISEL